MAPTAKKTTSHKKRATRSKPIVAPVKPEQVVTTEATDELKTKASVAPPPSSATPKSAAAQTEDQVKDERPTPVLIRQTYNNQRVGKAVAISAVILACLAAVAIWQNWSMVLQVVNPGSLIKPQPIEQLAVREMAMDEQKKLQALNAAGLQASASAAPEGGNSQTTPAYEQQLSSLTINELYAQLDAQITQLRSNGVGVSVWEQYKAQAQAAEEQKARTILMEAIQSAKERQALFAYYGK